MEIVKIGDERLRQACKPVRKPNRNIRALLRQMLETMYAANGVGLAAPQVGIAKRLAVVDVGDGPIELVNPEIVASEGEETDTEGCLSVPGMIGEVTRAQWVRVKAQDGEGRQVWVEGDGLLARALQHEIDHLDGILFIDKAANLRPAPAPGPGIVFMGTPEFAVVSLQHLLESGHDILAVVTQPDRPVGRGMAMTPPPVKRLAERHGIPVLQPRRARDPEFLERLRAIGPDLIVVVAYGQILPAELLQIPKLGCMNVHASLLPKYRGAAPFQWAIINGETETGITTMFMAEELDAGDILLQRRLAIGPDEDAASLHDRLAVLGAEVLLETIERLSKGELTRYPQDHTEATYYPRLDRDDGELDWSLSAQQVHDRVRGLNPWPGAFTFLDGRRIKIIAGKTGGATDGEPGTVQSINDDGLGVATGEGIYIITRLQPANGRVLSADEFARGYRITSGAKLGRAPGNMV